MPNFSFLSSWCARVCACIGGWGMLVFRGVLRAWRVNWPFGRVVLVIVAWCFVVGLARAVCGGSGAIRVCMLFSQGKGLFCWFLQSLYFCLYTMAVETWKIWKVTAPLGLGSHDKITTHQFLVAQKKEEKRTNPGIVFKTFLSRYWLWIWHLYSSKQVF